MSRSLLVITSSIATAPTATAAANSTGAGTGTGMDKSSLIYTFSFIGASALAGLLFLGIILKYVVKYRMWRSPVRTPLQPAHNLGDDYVSELPNIKEIVVISNPDGCACIAIVREQEISDGRPPFLTYETMISKKAFEDICKKQGCNDITSSRSMTHAASASDLAGMNARQSALMSQQKISPDHVIPEDHQGT